MKKLFILVLITLISQNSFSGMFAYECTVINEFNTNNDGELTAKNKIYKNKTFNVERKTGVILGGGLGNSSYKSKTIIDPGSKESEFKLLSKSHTLINTKGSVNSIYLTIEEYNENYIKPFILIFGTTVLSGTCK